MENLISQAFQTLRETLAGTVKSEMTIASPGDVGPTTQARGDVGNQNLVQFEMSPAEVGEWWQRVQNARDLIKKKEQKWDALLKEYLPIVSKSGEAETVKVQQHFRNVHSKIGQLFYKSPDLVLTADDLSMLNLQMPNPMPGPPDPETGQPGQMPPLTMADIVAVKQQVLKKKLGRDGIKANRLIDELLFDVLAWAGIGCCKIGYRCVYRPVTAPAPQPGSMLGLQQPMAQQPIPVPVFEEWYARRFSPKKLLVSEDLRSTRHDEDSTMIGMDFFMSPRDAKRAFNLSDEEVAALVEDDRVYKHEDDASKSGKKGLIRGAELWVKASAFTDEVHPQVIYQLVLIDGIKDRPVVWRMSPDQEFDPNTGQLTKDSLIGFPIRVLTIRDLSDSAFPDADSAFTNSEIKQLTTFRRQSVRLRDAAVGKMLFDTEAFSDEEQEKLQKPDVLWVGVEGGRLNMGADKLAAAIQQPTATQDDYRSQQIIQSDINETLGISANGAGSYSATARTATEAANVQSNMQGRNGKELARVVDFYLDLARMIDQLLMRYADQQDYVELTGPDGAKRMQVWDKAIISGRFLYDIAPDSSLMVDTAADFTRMAQFWNLVAKSPLANQAYILKKFAALRGLDPEKAVMPPAALKKPEEPKGKFSLSVSGADLANPLVVKMLIDNGIIKQEDAGLNVPVIPEPPEGSADKADAISQHTSSVSGRRENEPGAANHRDTMQGN